MSTKIIQIREKTTSDYDNLEFALANGAKNINSIDKSIIYGVKIDTTNSNPETALTYTDDAIGFTPSYMDFLSGQFKWGSWQDKFPFNQIRPCYIVNGGIITYLNPNNFAQDVNGNAIDITSTGAGDVMIEIPKIYYHLYKEGNYQYIKISNKKYAGFCCLAHTYKGAEKDFIYIGAYQATETYIYNLNTYEMRSVSGGSGKGNNSLNLWRLYAQTKGIGYENLLWNPLILLQALFIIQFKNLDSQAVMGFGFVSNNTYSTCGGLNDKGMNYCASGTANAQMKWLGIEDFWGSRSTWIDGAITTILDENNKVNLKIKSTDSDGSYEEINNKLPVGELTSGCIRKIVCDNKSGFCPNTFITNTNYNTYFCDWGEIKPSCVASFGGHIGFGNVSGEDKCAGSFCLSFIYGNTVENATYSGRLMYYN